MSNRYRIFDRKDVGRILYALKAKPAEFEIDRLRERLADYDPVDLLTLGAAMGTNWKLPQWEQHLSHEELNSGPHGCTKSLHGCIVPMLAARKRLWIGTSPTFL